MLGGVDDAHRLGVDGEEAVERGVVDVGSVQRGVLVAGRLVLADLLAVAHPRLAGLARVGDEDDRPVGGAGERGRLAEAVADEGADEAAVAEVDGGAVDGAALDLRARVGVGRDRVAAVAAGDVADDERDGGRRCLRRSRRACG